jgi:23S rRNA (cytosine1962-C5)-methyltransferase
LIVSSRIILKPHREKPILARHPWIFSGAIAQAENANDGDTVDVCDASGKFLARGYYNSHSQIAVRLWTWQDEPVNQDFLRARLERAIATRRVMLDPSRTNAYRLVNAEGDQMPGLIVDRYADYIIVQFLTLGVEKLKIEIIELLVKLLEPCGIYNRSDVDVREKEGMESAVGVLFGREPPEHLEICENRFRFFVDVKRGQKTGFYLDQRENRERVMQMLSPRSDSVADRAREFLNVFSYTGAFAVYVCALDVHARITNLDASRDALELARTNMELNGYRERGECVQGDAFQALRKYRDQAKSFDAIILDPPKFVQSQSQLHSGLRGYKDINLLALKLLNPGGSLVTFSCSGQVSAELFQKIVFEAAVDAGKQVQIVGRLSQSSDHPILLSFPEGEYLKGLVCRLVD